MFKTTHGKKDWLHLDGKHYFWNGTEWQLDNPIPDIIRDIVSKRELIQAPDQAQDTPTPTVRDSMDMK